MGLANDGVRVRVRIRSKVRGGQRVRVRVRVRVTVRSKVREGQSEDACLILFKLHDHTSLPIVSTLDDLYVIAQFEIFYDLRER